MYCELVRMWKEAAVCLFKNDPRICLEDQRKTTKHLSQHSQSQGRDLNPGPIEYETEMLSIRLRRFERRRRW
jgi:hypothetical protein